MSAEPVPVIVYGLGPIGQRIAARVDAPTTPGCILVGGVDLDLARAERELRAALRADGRSLNLAESLSAVLEGAEAGPGVVVHATGSRLGDVAPQLIECAEHGWDVISTCEELSYPTAVDPAIASMIDEVARAHAVTVLGTGINPGFLLDTLPLVLACAGVVVSSVSVRRQVNTDERRVPLQQKAGVAMTRAEFEQLAATGRIGHVGLRQSAYLLASGLGWEVEAYEESIEPVLAKGPTSTPLGTVAQGDVLGQRQRAQATCDGGATIRYDLEMSSGVANLDEIDLVGPPDLHQSIRGLNGDLGTEAVVTNLVPAVAYARPGLLTMVDLLGIAQVRPLRVGPAGGRREPTR